MWSVAVDLVVSGAILPLFFTAGDTLLSVCVLLCEESEVLCVLLPWLSMYAAVGVLHLCRPANRAAGQSSGCV
jgi:hypothetical protein